MKINGNVFQSKSALQTHMHAVHLKMRNYKCKDCSRDYTNSAVLEMHRVKMHGAEPRYQCKKCNVGFTNRHEIVSHFITCSPGYNPPKRVIFPVPVVKDGRTVCTICEKDYLNYASWIAHYYAEHAQELKVFECNICHKKSNKLGNHKIHMLTHTGARPHRCEVCDKTFVQKSSLKTHR